MFGFQRVADLIWSAADQRARGFLMGATSGRTTLNGEGLQHQDGHSLLMAHTNPRFERGTPPSPTSWRPSSATASKRCTLTTKTCSTTSPSTTKTTPCPKPRGRRGHHQGHVPASWRTQRRRTARSPHRLGPHHGASAGRREKLETYGVRCEIYSATSYGELRREAWRATGTTGSTPPTIFRSPTWRRCWLNRSRPSPSQTTWRPFRT